MEHFTELINSYLPEPHASLLNGIIFGRDLETIYSFKENLKKVGLIHIVVLSGMNITLLSAIVLSTTVEFIGRKIATLFTIVIIIAFILFVGLEAPIVRAAIMGILSLIAVLYGRKTIALYTLFLSAVIMIIIWPEWLSSISFHLSFAATLGIILFGTKQEDEKVLDSKQIKTLKSKIYEYIQDELRVTLSAQLFTIPLIFFYFRQISLVAPIANILVSFIIPPLMIVGLIAIAVGSVWWTGGFIISWFSYGLLSYLIWVVETLVKIRYASVSF